MKINRKSLVYIRISFSIIGWRGVKSYDVESKVVDKLKEYSYFEWERCTVTTGMI